MSDINLDFIVANNSINFTVQPNDITITPEDIQLTLNANFQPLAGGNITQLQYNNGGILAGIPTVTYNGSNLSLGNVANIKITGGVNGYVLQTDGTGNLDWTLMSGNGGGGNGTPGGSNTQIQYNDSGSFGGNTGFTFNEVSGNVAIPGSLAVVGNITGNVQSAYLANFATTANSVAGANVSGQVGNALVANLANFATTANSVAGANVSGQVNYAAVANSVAVANVSGIGNIATINLNGSNSNVLFGNGVFATIANVANANFANFAGNVTVAAQGNITSLGILTDLLLSNSKIHLGAGSYANQGANAIAIGRSAGVTSQGANSIAIGQSAGSNAQTSDSIAIGNSAANTTQGEKAIAIGWRAGSVFQGNFSIAIGLAAADLQQGINALAIGKDAGAEYQGANTVAIGNQAGAFLQGNTSIAIGLGAAVSDQGANSIAIGTDAGGIGQGNQSIAIGYKAFTGVNNSIILNSTVTSLSATQANSLFVKPIRDVTGNVDFTKTLKYNPTTGEIGYI
jgi:hypothetical protein